MARLNGNIVAEKVAGGEVAGYQQPAGVKVPGKKKPQFLGARVGVGLPPFLEVARPADLTPLEVQMHFAAWNLKHATKSLMAQQTRLMLGPGPQVQEMPVPEPMIEAKPYKVLDYQERVAEFRRAHKPNPPAWTIEREKKAA